MLQNSLNEKRVCITHNPQITPEKTNATLNSIHKLYLPKKKQIKEHYYDSV